jgi:hypothetical protein
MLLLNTKTCILTLVATFFALSRATPAQDLDYPLSTMRADVKEASVVVRIDITDTKPTGDNDGYYYGFIASGRVVQSFKGKFKRGQPLEFFVRAENGFDHTCMRGDKIAFLTSFTDRKNGPFQELPSGNSTVTYTPELLAKVERVASSSRRWRTRHKRAPKHNHAAQPTANRAALIR